MKGVNICGKKLCLPLGGGSENFNILESFDYCPCYFSNTNFNEITVPDDTDIILIVGSLSPSGIGAGEHHYPMPQGQLVAKILSKVGDIASFNITNFVNRDFSGSTQITVEWVSEKKLNVMESKDNYMHIVFMKKSL